ncbi:MAG TPA: fumarylacetoacetase [Mycobacteriales bacterium]|nr:fumarylacetoacetase [Mycobacteriales bacterium]
MSTAAPRGWPPLPEDTLFGLDNLPYGVFAPPGGARRVGVAVGAAVLDLAAALGEEVFARPSLNAFLAGGPDRWRRTRARLVDLLTDARHRPVVEPALYPAGSVAMSLPFEVADYVDFYASREHAENLGRILRPDSKPLPPNWRHLPAGYHGRAGTVVVSGTPVVRPCGQRRGDAADPAPVFGPSTRLDVEAEVGFVVGVPSRPGHPVPTSAFAEHVFGAVLVNDWSARDIQAWEYRPLGPHLGKSFATSVSPWVVPLDALAAARVPPPEQCPEPLPYLRCAQPWGLDLTLSIRLNGQEVSRPPFAGMYWTAAQQLAHLTVNGASLRTGDLFASGTVSGPDRDQRGSLIELGWNGAEPLVLPDGTTRAFLADGDTVTITATAPGTGGGRIGFGAVTGTVRPAVIGGRAP